jgi:type VI secretion system protein ImpI
MNTTSIAHRLTLVVDNPQTLQKGSQPRHLFDTAGGTIGTRSADWLLHDRSGHVQPIHCEIRHEDDRFFIIDRCGQTRVNDQMEPLGMLASAQLRSADKIHIGPYRIIVNLDDEAHNLPDPSRHLAQHEVDELLSSASKDYLDSLPNANDDLPPVSPHAQPVPGWSEFEALSEPQAPQGLLDPLLALEEASRPHAGLSSISSSLDHHHYGQSTLAAQADLSATRFEAVSGAPLHTSGDSHMSGQNTSSAAVNEWIQGHYAQGGDPAGLVAPLVEGLGAPVGALDAYAAHALMFEAGATLAALIRGLDALNQASSGQRLGLAKRTLQPIEDNPLRLGQSYPDTVRALFSSERSLVHLSPTAAVEESLEQIRQQHSAMLKAVAAGLSALLQAFAPDQLERRFARYRTGKSEQALLPGDESWQMYRHYYEELNSSRQQGFDKLFWEVFDQAYDQALRVEAQ